ncbi:MAG TPA: hypothetical protein PKA63_13670 [Oligoflexia bacterium]|nr:hypothetical protein [Oligoflexia bacterium]HMP49711.1 hypothetical protein [Oligoflexia bacterium]
MIDRFYSKSDDPFFTIADLFGYIVTFFLIWFIWTCYKAASNVATKAKETVVQSVSPLAEKISTIKENNSEITDETAAYSASDLIDPGLFKEKGEGENNKNDVKTKVLNTAYSLKDYLSTEINELPSPRDALYAINNSIKDVITEATGVTPINSKEKKNTLNKNKKRMNDKDALAPL